MKTVLTIEQFEDLCVNRNGAVKIFIDEGVVEINKESAYELGLFLYRVLDLLAPEVEAEEEADEEEIIAKK